MTEKNGESLLHQLRIYILKAASISVSLHKKEVGLIVKLGYKSVISKNGAPRAGVSCFFVTFLVLIGTAAAEVARTHLRAIFLEFTVCCSRFGIYNTGPSPSRWSIRLDACESVTLALRSVTVLAIWLLALKHRASTVLWIIGIFLVSNLLFNGFRFRGSHALCITCTVSMLQGLVQNTSTLLR